MARDGEGLTLASRAPKARLLDLTRSVSRLGQGPMTGVDRVEHAYLQQLLSLPVPLFALVRTRAGYLLLDRSGVQGIADRISGKTALGPTDRMGRWMWRGAPIRARAEASTRRLAVARCLPFGLTRLLRRHLPAETAYLNTGHTDLTARVFRAIKSLPGGRVAVLVHDVIPLDHPEFTRPGTTGAFARKMRQVSAGADLVIFNSTDSQTRAARHFAGYGRVPPSVVAHLGVTSARPAPQDLPAALDLSQPWFVTIGTIEPRKNHAFLLDLWEKLAAEGPAAEIPNLFILGGRGWNNEAVFKRLDGAAVMESSVFELPGLSDGAVSALLQGATALLFPSHAEGFGLPLAEAAGLGVPAICSALPVFHEILGDYPVYLDVNDSYSWLETIRSMVKATGQGQDPLNGPRQARGLPTWGEHFKTVLSLT